VEVVRDRGVEAALDVVGARGASSAVGAASVASDWLVAIRAGSAEAATVVMVGRGEEYT
jgi:hypothetical protein